MPLVLLICGREHIIRTTTGPVLVRISWHSRFCVHRNDHQDSLASGLAVSEFAPNGKWADEIRGLWLCVEARLDLAATTIQTATAERFWIASLRLQ
jgi:hypothetical protein